MKLPKNQGDEDGLCGLYAILNSILYLYPHMTEDEQADIFKTCARFLTRWPEILWAGTSTDEVRGMLRQFSNEKDPEHHIITIERLHGHEGFGAFYDHLHSWVQPNSQVAIIGLDKPYEHWTVAREVSGSRIILQDSCKLHFISRDQSGLPSSSAKWQIDPSCTFLISKTQ